MPTCSAPPSSRTTSASAPRATPISWSASRITAREVLATGVEWTFAPTLAVARHLLGTHLRELQRATALVASYAATVVRGLQGDLGQDSVIACAKHWIGDGGTTGGRDQGNTVISEDELERTHMAPTCRRSRRACSP
jgi:beta-glucosidase